MFSLELQESEAFPGEPLRGTVAHSPQAGATLSPGAQTPDDKPGSPAGQTGWPWALPCAWDVVFPVPEGLRPETLGFPRVPTFLAPPLESLSAAGREI